jgi:hypothetical protein
MPRRYTYNRRRTRRNPEYRRRSVFMQPGVQITIIVVAALVIYIILQSAGR